MPAHLKGKVAVVTGGGRGIGKAVALELARQGAKVVVTDIGAELDGTGRSKEFADGVVKEIKKKKGEAIADYSDVSDYAQAKRPIDLAVKTYGRLDILVNSVGNARPKLLLDCSQEDLDILIDVMLKGKLYATRHAAAVMAKQQTGSIVNIASNIGLIRMTRRVAYGAAQVGIIGFSNVAAVELGPLGVTVNTICPGATESRLIREAMRLAKLELNNPIIAPTERSTAFLTPNPAEDCATFAAYLCTDAAKGINGQVFYVAGPHISRAEHWSLSKNIYKNGHWTMEELIEAMPKTVLQGVPNPAPRLKRVPL